jgi:hypothetical protein
MAKYPDMGYAWLIELKYMKRSEFSEEKMRAKLAEAEGQLAGYAADERVVRDSGGARLRCLVLVFSGWELKAAEECDLPGTE